MNHRISETSIDDEKIITNKVVLLPETEIGLRLDQEVALGFWFVGLAFRRKDVLFTPYGHIDFCLQEKKMTSKPYSIEDIVHQVDLLEICYNGNVISPSESDRVVEFVLRFLKQDLPVWHTINSLSDFMEIRE